MNTHRSCLALLLALPLAADAGEIFGWRGDGTGRFPDATPVTEWSAKKNVRWATVVGKSYASPIIAGQSVFVAAEPNLLICLDRVGGKERWRIEIKPGDLADEKSKTGAAAYVLPPSGSGMMAATPLTDGAKVYVVLANGIVRAVDLAGKPVWAAYIDAEQNTSYGRAASPIMVGGKLIVSMTNLYAFDPATGKQLWVNEDAKSTYGTPAGGTIGGVAVVVTPGGDVVRLDNGKGVNSGIGRSFNGSPLIKDDVVYYGDAAIRAARLAGPEFKDEEVWTGSVTGEVFASPILHNDLFFLENGNGELSVFDAKSKGEAKALVEGRVLFTGGGGSEPIAYASITLAGKYLFINSNQGEMLVLEATREAKQVAKNSLPDGSGAAPIFAGRDMYVRDGDRLLCIGE